jgi:hypothetical protein
MIVEYAQKEKMHSEELAEIKKELEKVGKQKGDILRSSNNRIF